MNQEYQSIVPSGKEDNKQLSRDVLRRAGLAANQVAARHRFSDYKLRRSENTLRRQRADLNLFIEFLSSLRLDSGDLFESASAWQNITWGLVETFLKWQLSEGYALPSINVRLSTIKTYARLAMQSGELTPQEFALIKAIQSYTHKEQPRIDARRPVTRVGDKKAVPVPISGEQADLLKSQPQNQAQGRRDNVIMSLLLDHGLRVGELAMLTVDMVDLQSGLLTFFRPKVGKKQVHRLSNDTFKALSSYSGFGDMPEKGPLLRRSKKNASLGKPGMTERAITQRVNTLGKQIGLFGLSAHDCRHFWATTAARHGTDPFALQEAGGWASLAMPRRYIQDNEISNEGVYLE